MKFIAIYRNNASSSCPTPLFLTKEKNLDFFLEGLSLNFSCSLHLIVSSTQTYMAAYIHVCELFLPPEQRDRSCGRWGCGSRGSKTLAKGWLFSEPGQTVLTQPGRVLAPKWDMKATGEPGPLMKRQRDQEHISVMTNRFPWPTIRRTKDVSVDTLMVRWLKTNGPSPTQWPDTT